MKRKISFMLVVIVIAVAMFAVPTMAADDNVISTNNVTEQELALGKPVIITDEFVVDGEEYISEIEITRIPMKGRAVPGQVQDEVKLTIRNARNNNDNYGYYRTRFVHDPNKRVMVAGWEPQNEPSRGYYARGAKGTFSVGNCQTVDNSPANVMSYGHFYDSGRAVWVTAEISYGEPGEGFGINVTRSDGYFG